MQQSLLSLLELYRLQHGRMPDFAKYPQGDQLWSYTLANGEITSQRDGAFGPYLACRMTNPHNGRSDILMLSGSVPPVPVAPQSAGWLYYPDAVRVIATDAGGDRPFAVRRPQYMKVVRERLKAHCAGRGLFEGAMHIAMNRDDQDPPWLLAIPFGPPILLNSLALFAVCHRIRRRGLARGKETERERPRNG